MGNNYMEREKNTFTTNPFAAENSKNYTAADIYIRNNGRKDIKKISEKIKYTENLYQEAAVVYVIKSDNHKPANTDISRVTAKIISASEYTGVSADVIACIVKRESHFRETGLSDLAGKGPMGLTNVAIKDLYARPKNYDKKLEELINKYGSLQKVFAAKKSNPILDLGNFGNILYQYENWTNLRNAVKKDYELNLKVGAYIYKYQLNKSLTNKKISIANKEYEAFKNYNNSYFKNNYADSSVATLKDARTAASQDEKYLAALEKTQKQIQAA